MVKVLRYDLGLTAVVQEGEAHSTSVGIWVNAGSAFEDKNNNGISHFVEHMLFKGTSKYSAFDISKGFENRGAVINAFTSKDCTCYFFKAINDQTEPCFKLLSHIFSDSVFDQTELDRERKVVVEEINMQEDAPEEICYDMLASASYDGKLSQTIIGSSSNVLRFNKDDITAYMNTHYHPSNTVVAFAGGITAEQADAMIKQHLLPYLRKGGARSECAKNLIKTETNIRIDEKFEQSNLMIAFEGLPFNHPDLPALYVLNVLLGGGMSSRLFQRVRETLGLAYSVYTTPSVHTNAGTFNICVNYTASNTGKLLSAIKGEIDVLLAKGITDEEFLRAKTQLKSALVFSQENPQSQMLSIGKLMLLAGTPLDLAKRLEDIQSVSREKLLSIASSVLTKQPALAYLGKQPDVNPKW